MAIDSSNAFLFDDESFKYYHENYVKYPNRIYNPLNPDGMGYVILRQDNTFAEQVTQSNTIYEIRYNFDLDGDVTIPANCILKFEGGSISGENTITGNNTGIEAGLVKIFDTDITLSGTWNVAETYPEWFGAKGDGVTNDRLAIQKCIDISDNIKGDNNKVYAVDSSPYEHCLTIRRDNQSLAIKLLDLGNYNTQTSEYRGRGVIFCDSKNGFTFIGEISSINDDIPVSGGSGATLEMFARAGIVCYGDCGNFNIAMNCSNLYCGIIAGSQNYLPYISRNGVNGVYNGLFNITAYRVAYPIALANANKNRIYVKGDSMHRIVWLCGDYNTIDAYGKNYFAGGSAPAHIILYNNFIETSQGQYTLVGSNYNTITYKELQNETAIISESSVFSYRPLRDDELIIPSFSGSQSFIGNVFNIYCKTEQIHINVPKYIFRSPTSDFIYSAGDVYLEAVINIYGDSTKYTGARGIAFEVDGLINNFTINNYTKKKIRFDIEDNKPDSLYTINGNQKTVINSLSGDVSIKGKSSEVTITPLTEMDGNVYINSLDSTITINAERNRKHTHIVRYNYFPLRNGIQPSPTKNNAGTFYMNTEARRPVFCAIDDNLGTVKWVYSDGAASDARRSGTFAQKPASNNIYVGFKYFCTDKQTVEGATDGIEIIHKGNDVWVDALGRVVS